MSGNEDEHLNMSDSLAFEYVSGTLPVNERKKVKERLLQDEHLQKEVHFWEEQLMAMQNVNDYKAPLDTTWAAIESRLDFAKPHADEKSSRENNTSRWGFSFWKLTSGILALGWLVTIAFVFSDYRVDTNKQINANYVAVLTDTAGEAKLTAHASQDGKQLWLKWDESKPVEPGKSIQLWAQSRRDGQTRSLYVFDGSIDGGSKQTMMLSEANMRLIRDADFLILTEEDAGGSAIDEPSSTLIAKGICVRLDNKSLIDS